MTFRRLLVVAITFLSGLYFFLEFLLPEEIAGYRFGKYHQEIMLGVRVVGSMAFGLGIINILQVHGGRILKLQKDWGNSLALILGFALMLAIDGFQFIRTIGENRQVDQLEQLADFVQHVEEERLAEKLAVPNQSPVPAQSRILSLLPVLDKHAAQWTELQARQSGLPQSSENDEWTKASAKVQAELTTAKQITTTLSASYAAMSHRQVVETTDSEIEALQSALKKAAQAEREANELLLQQSTNSKLSRLLYEGFFVSLGSAMFALLAFYIASAAYRAFRVRSIEASILMLTATLMILGQIPQGKIYISEQLPLVRLWILKNINTPGNRAIYFGSTIAALAMAVRMWLSLEKSPLDSEYKAEGRDA